MAVREFGGLVTLWDVVFCVLGEAAASIVSQLGQL